jgi:hypothetical protein
MTGRAIAAITWSDHLAAITWLIVRLYRAGREKVSDPDDYFEQLHSNVGGHRRDASSASSSAR